VRFRVYIDGEITLSEDEIWPDGDGPAEPTLADVKAVMEKCGSEGSVLEDWNLMQYVRVTVGPDGPGRGVEVW
jgi:hypothetical protein